MNESYLPVIIRWSEEDKAYLASTSLEGCISHGDTRAEALENLEKTIAEWMVSAEQMGWNIPSLSQSLEIRNLEYFK